MAELKTKKNKASVAAFLSKVDEARREDCRTIVKMMQEATGAKPQMWGTSIVGFGTYRYKYPSGHEGEWMVMGFSPRKADLTLYLMPGVQGFAPELKKLGKHKTGVSCLYVKRLSDLDLKVLRGMLKKAAKKMKEKRIG